MKMSKLLLGFFLLALSSFLACGGDGTSQDQASDTSRALSASIIGRIADVGVPAQSMFQAADAQCPEVIVTLNGTPADIVIDDDCTFLISGVRPSEAVVLGIELPDLGISGTIELANVVEGELIEISVEVGSNSLTISVIRRQEPAPTNEIPEVIQKNENNVTILVPAGLYDQTLTVLGNNFTLAGEAGDDCGSGDWTIIGGKVIIDGNNATFRNIAFNGPVEVRGNNTRFINCCIDGVLLLFGHNTDISDDDHNGDDCDDGDHDGCDDDETNAPGMSLACERPLALT